MFRSIDEVAERFAGLRYITNRTIATVVYLAAEMKKPILVEGPAGVGKTELAKVLAAAVGHELIRLQCYEGLDEAKALYEWEYAKQLLYTQILKDKETGAPRCNVTMRAGDIAAMPADIRHQGYSAKRSMLLVWENNSGKIPALIAEGKAPVTPVKF